ncbi:MAG: hypothetical protein DME63_04190, partial [Verrucomicrobia bacterium]
MFYWSLQKFSISNASQHWDFAARFWDTLARIEREKYPVSQFGRFDETSTCRGRIYSWAYGSKEADSQVGVA